MEKLKKNAAEAIIAIITIAMLSSCGTVWQIDMVSTCPAYAGVTEAELGEDMYANQQWDEEESN